MQEAKDPMESEKYITSKNFAELLNREGKTLSAWGN